MAGLGQSYKVRAQDAQEFFGPISKSKEKHRCLGSSRHGSPGQLNMTGMEIGVKTAERKGNSLYRLKTQVALHILMESIGMSWFETKLYFKTMILWNSLTVALQRGSGQSKSSLSLAYIKYGLARFTINVSKNPQEQQNSICRLNCN